MRHGIAPAIVTAFDLLRLSTKIQAEQLSRRLRGLLSFPARPAGRRCLYVAEIQVIALWAAYVGRAMLGTSRFQVNSGGDNVSAYGRFFWDRLASCGTCALWSGQVNGGTPAYVDPNSDVFHPAVALPALLFGTLQGFKVTIVVCLFLGGLACWWLALELGVSSPARVAAGLMGAVGGYMAGRSFQGLVVVLTSVAAAAFVLPALLRLRRLPNRRSAGLLGLVLGQFALAGQGYLQFGYLMMAIIPGILLAGHLHEWRTYLWRVIEAFIIGTLTAAVFLFPFLRYYPEFSKPVDPSFQSHQTFRYIILNLVINDWDYFQLDKLLGKQSLPGLYVNYVGWVVIIFAVIGGYVLWQRSKSTFLVLFLLAIAALWIGSGAPFQHLARSWAPQEIQDFAVSIRNPTFIAGAAVPPIIGLAAMGVDSGLHWTLDESSSATGVISMRWVRLGVSTSVRIATIALLILGLRNLESAARQWLLVEEVSTQRAEVFLDTLATNEIAWVSLRTIDGYKCSASMRDTKSPMHGDRGVLVISMSARRRSLPFASILDWLPTIWSR